MHQSDSQCTTQSAPYDEYAKMVLKCIGGREALRDHFKKNASEIAAWFARSYAGFVLHGLPKMSGDELLEISQAPGLLVERGADVVNQIYMDMIESGEIDHGFVEAQPGAEDNGPAL